MSIANHFFPHYLFPKALLSRIATATGTVAVLSHCGPAFLFALVSAVSFSCDNSSDEFITSNDQFSLSTDRGENCEKATQLDSFPVVLRGNVENSTDEIDTPEGCFPRWSEPMAPEHVYRFTLSEKSIVSFAVNAGSISDFRLFLRRGETPSACQSEDNGNPLWCGKWEEWVNAGEVPDIEVHLEAGTYYVIVESSSKHSEGAYSVEMNVAPAPPVSASCDGAIPIEPKDQVLSGFIDRSVLSEMFTTECQASLEEEWVGGAGHAYSIQVEEDTLLHVDGVSSTENFFDKTVLLIELRTDCTDAASKTHCMLDASNYHGYDNDPLGAVLRPGQTYHFIVMAVNEEFNPSGGNYRLQLDFEPVNKIADGSTCEGATLIEPVPQIIAGNLRDGDDTTVEGLGSCDYDSERTHIYKLIPQNDTILKISGLQYSPSIVYSIRESECGVSESGSVDSEIWCAEGDYSYTFGQIGGEMQLEVAFLRANVEYFIHVSGPNYAPRDVAYSLRLGFEPPTHKTTELCGHDTSTVIPFESQQFVGTIGYSDPSVSVQSPCQDSDDNLPGHVYQFTVPEGSGKSTVHAAIKSVDPISVGIRRTCDDQVAPDGYLARCVDTFDFPTEYSLRQLDGSPPLHDEYPFKNALVAELTPGTYYLFVESTKDLYTTVNPKYYNVYDIILDVTSTPESSGDSCEAGGPIPLAAEDQTLVGSLLENNPLQRMFAVDSATNCRLPEGTGDDEFDRWGEFGARAYSFTTPDQDLTLYLKDNDPRTFVSLHEGFCGQERACQDFDDSWWATTSIEAALERNTHYILIVSGPNYKLDLNFEPTLVHPGESCAAPTWIDATTLGTQTLFGDFMTSTDDHRGTNGDGIESSCSANSRNGFLGSREHVYAFEITEDTLFEATSVQRHIAGARMHLFLRRQSDLVDCSERSASTEVACFFNDENDYPVAKLSAELEPGVYYLFIEHEKVTSEAETETSFISGLQSYDLTVQFHGARGKELSAPPHEETRTNFGLDDDDLTVRIGSDRWVVDVDTAEVYHLQGFVKTPVSIRTFLTKWYEAKGKTPVTTTRLWATHSCHDRNTYTTQASPLAFNLRYVAYSDGFVIDFESTAGGEGGSYIIQGENGGTTIRHWSGEVRAFEGGTASMNDEYSLSWRHSLNARGKASMRFERGQWRLLVKPDAPNGFNRTNCGPKDPVRKNTILRWSLPRSLHNFEDLPPPSVFRNYQGGDDLAVQVGTELMVLDGDTGRVRRTINGKATPKRRTIRDFVNAWYAISGEPVRWADVRATFQCSDSEVVQATFPKIHHSRPKNFQVKAIAWDDGVVFSAYSWGRADYILQGTDPNAAGDLSTGVIVRAFQGGHNIHTRQGDRLDFRHAWNHPIGQVVGNRLILRASNARGTVRTQCGGKTPVVPDTNLHWIIPGGLAPLD